MIEGIKKYPDYRDSGVPWLGKVPEHWSMVRIKNVFREMEERSGDGQGLLLSLTRERGLIPQSQASKRQASAEDLSKYKVCHPGDLVMNRMQAWSGMFSVADVQGLVSPDYSVFRQVRAADVDYFEHLFKTPLIVEQFALRSKGIGSGFNRLYTPDFGAVPATLPPLEEQSAIVRFLNHTDRRIRRYLKAKRQLVALLNEQKQAIIHRAVTRGLDPNVRLKPSGVEWLGEMPQHCEVWQIGHFARIGNGSTPSRGNTAYWTDGKYPWLNSSCVNLGTITGANQFVTEVALKECHLPKVRPNSVLVAITGQGKTRGMAALLKVESTINQHVAYITPQKAIISSEFLHLALLGAYSELRAISEASGSTKGALTCGDLRHFQVAVPPILEQQKLLDMVKHETRTSNEAISRSQYENELLREYRTRLFADVVTGKLDVRSAAARLPVETDEQAVLDIGEVLAVGDEAIEDTDLDAVPEEAEV